MAERDQNRIGMFDKQLDYQRAMDNKQLVRGSGSRHLVDVRLIDP